MADGDFPNCPPRIVVTAEVALGLKPYIQSSAIAENLFDTAIGYILSKENADNGFSDEADNRQRAGYGLCCFGS